jgi:hypothetical protein
MIQDATSGQFLPNIPAGTIRSKSRAVTSSRETWIFVVLITFRFAK